MRWSQWRGWERLKLKINRRRQVSIHLIHVRIKALKIAHREGKAILWNMLQLLTLNNTKNMAVFMKKIIHQSMMTLSSWIRARCSRKAVMIWGIHSSMIAWSRLERSSPQRENWFETLRKSKSLSEAIEQTWSNLEQALIISTLSIRRRPQSRVIWSSWKMNSSSRATSWDFLTKFNPLVWLPESSIKLTGQTLRYLTMRLCPLSSYRHWRKKQNVTTNTAKTITCAINSLHSIW